MYKFEGCRITVVMNDDRRYVIGDIDTYVEVGRSYYHHLDSKKSTLVRIKNTRHLQMKEYRQLDGKKRAFVKHIGYDYYHDRTFEPLYIEDIKSIHVEKL